MINFDDKNAKERIGFPYLLIEIQLFTLILLEMNIFLKKYLKKSRAHLSLITCLEYKMMILLCADFIVLLS